MSLRAQPRGAAALDHRGAGADLPAAGNGPGFRPGPVRARSAPGRTVDADRIGRALDRLFDADRATLLTEVVVAVGTRFAVRCARLHNDSTTIRFCGQYRRARGRRMRGWRASAITRGYSRGHRPDLKQLLFSLTTRADGEVPVEFRCADGNTNDSTTHIVTWEALRAVAGRADFPYVADSKLFTRENMDDIDRRHGRFVTVLPRSRLEDAELRKGNQANAPAWEIVWDRPNARRKGGRRDRWYVCRASCQFAPYSRPPVFGMGGQWFWPDREPGVCTHRGPPVFGR
ncbi:MAG: IS1634 family transposase [Acidobacteriota bacterium]